MELTKLKDNIDDISREYLELVKYQLTTIKFHGREIYDCLETGSLTNRLAEIIASRNGAWIERKENWTVFPLIFRDKDVKVNQNLCPRTTDILKQLDKVVHTAAITVLSQGELGWHDDKTALPTKTTLVYHLPIVNFGNDSYIVFNHDGVEKKYMYERGEHYFFDTRIPHNVYNNSLLPRVILYIEYEP
uniref:Aspartyl/asparaginyl beta-hydroxylase n=1 Tax=Marseillevirus LCMAC101 TaxID=2506602 RepID=A0A481YS72_9VIRU|nr:MAG: aspartyl/asparaginyl beta-hydroxylase [Marseillevirus LCMAC101]